jgi:hypothetical protein
MSRWHDHPCSDVPEPSLTHGGGGPGVMIHGSDARFPGSAHPGGRQFEPA